jgi:hypothetical protein
MNPWNYIAALVGAVIAYIVSLKFKLKKSEAKNGKLEAKEELAKIAEKARKDVENSTFPERARDFTEIIRRGQRLPGGDPTSNRGGDESAD